MTYCIIKLNITLFWEYNPRVNWYLDPKVSTSATLTAKAAIFSETTVTSYQSTLRHIPDVGKAHQQRYEDLIAHFSDLFLFSN